MKKRTFFDSNIDFCSKICKKMDNLFFNINDSFKIRTCSQNKNRKILGLFTQFLLAIPIIMIVNILLYILLKILLINSQTFLSIGFFSNLIPMSYDFLNQIPTIVISGIIALMTIFFTIIVLSFNLNSKLPDKIIYKYIIYDWKVTIYLSMLAGFLLIQLSIMLLNFYDVSWSYVFILNLIISIIATIIFFYWFVKITNKKGIFWVLNKNIEHQHFAPASNNGFSANSRNISINSSGDYYILKSNLFDNKKIPLEPPQSITKNTLPLFLNYNNKEGIQHTSFASLAGITKIDYKKIESLTKSNLEIINYVMFPKEGTFVSQMGLLYKFCFYTKDETKQKDLIKELSKAIKIIEPKEIEEINDWMLFLDHSRKHNPKEIEDDFNFLKAILKKAVSSNQFNLIKLIFDTLERNFDENQKNNDKILEQTISLIYSLKHNFSNNFQMLQFIQSRFKNIMINYSLILNNKYSSKYVTAVLYLSEFIRFDFMKKFEEEVDLNKLDEYNQIINDNIELSNQILYNTINLYFKELKYYEVYLKEHMQQFISGLQFYYDDPYHYNRNYYNLNKEEKEIIDKKCKIIKENKDARKIKITNSAFYLLSLIEEKKVSSKLSNLILDFLEFGDVYADIDPAPSWMMKEKLHPEGAFVVPRFPKEKYIIIYLLYSDLEKNKLPIPKWEYSKLHLAEELKRMAESITHEELLCWVDVKVEKFEEVKKKLINLFSQAITKCNEDEQNKIVDSKIDSNLVKQFEESINTYFNDNAILRKIFQKNNNYEERLDKKPKKQPNQALGFFFIFEKSYFIENPPIPWARTLESDGISLARNENEQILKEILGSKRISKLKQNLEISILNGIKKLRNKENLIIIIDNSQDDKLIKIPSFTHKYKFQHHLSDDEKHFSFKGILKYEEVEIPVYEFNVGALIILDGGNVGKLVQYSPYNEINKRIYVGIEDLNQNDIKNLKDIEAPKTKVKVRILEKFRVENINKKAFQAYRLNEETSK